MKASDSPPKDFDLEDYDAEDAPNLEGFLFPATYPIVKKETAKELVSQQLEAFRSNFDGVDLSYAKSKNLTPYDVLIIASMIEKEIQVPEERKLAAAVIYNRLKAGDTLGIDATIRYYLGNYDEQLTESELADPHPYNTRVNPGLPPTPISNPGVASIEAAANPAKSDALLLRGQAGNLRRARLRRDPGGVRPGRAGLPAGACRSRAAPRPTAERPGARGRRLGSAHAPARRPRPPGLALAFAGDAERRARRARARRLVLRGDRGRAGAFRGAGRARFPTTASPAST